MNTENYEQEIDLKELFFYLLYRWRILLLAAVIGAAVLGSFRLIKSTASSNQAGELISEQESVLLAEEYETEKMALEQSLEKLQKDLEEQNRYLLEAPYMQINPYEVFYASADLLVEVQGQNAQAAVKNLIEAYKSDVIRGGYLTELAQSMETETGYLKELISVWGDPGVMEPSYLLTEFPTIQVHQGTLSVQVSGSSKIWTERLLQNILKELEERQKDLNKDLAEHTLQELRSSVISGVDTGILDRQQKMRGYVTSICKSRDEITQSLEILESSKQELLKAEAESAGAALNKKELIKYIVLGFLAGGFLLSCCLCAVYLLNDRVLSEKEIVSRFAVKRLGEFKAQPKPRSFSGIDRWIRRLAGDDSITEESVVYEMIQTNIQNYAGERRNLLLTGLASEELINQISERLDSELPDYHFEIGRDVLSNAGARRQLAACEGVVFIEEKGSSRYSLIGQELKLAEELGVEVIGVIVG